MLCMLSPSHPHLRSLKPLPYPPTCLPSPQRQCSWWVLTKGAPEAVQKLLAHVPLHYESCYKSHAAEGARVLALAYK